jgi:DoxX-like family
MTEQRIRMKTALTGLQWTLGLVILLEAILFVMPGAAHDFAKTHMPDIVRQGLGWGEIIGAVLLLIPWTAVRGAWFLVGIFVLAIVVHLLHGTFNVGNLLIYTAAAWAIASGKAPAQAVG